MIISVLLRTSSGEEFTISILQERKGHKRERKNRGARSKIETVVIERGQSLIRITICKGGFRDLIVF
jgi:hypothetical protein